MKTLNLLTFILLLGSGTVIAQEIVEETPKDQCRAEALLYWAGGDEQIKEIDEKCYGLALKDAEGNRNISKTFDAEGRVVIGYENMVFTKDIESDEEKIKILAGKFTTLNKVEYVNVSSDNKLVLVLNKVDEENKELLVFTNKSHGNVTPIRVYRGEHINGLISASMTLSQTTIHFSAMKDGELNVYQVDIDKDSRNPNSNQQPIYTSIFKYGEFEIAPSYVSFSVDNKYVAISVEDSLQVMSRVDNSVVKTVDIIAGDYKGMSNIYAVKDEGQFLIRGDKDSSTIVIQQEDIEEIVE